RCVIRKVAVNRFISLVQTLVEIIATERGNCLAPTGEAGAVFLRRVRDPGVWRLFLPPDLKFLSCHWRAPGIGQPESDLRQITAASRCRPGRPDDGRRRKRRLN